ncbi:hypothetical protein C8R46DRAFT_203520 [Mycena filopes]|nr:hypothetical protein C8R46DRAFT_203520 [Mycena filopes]
MACGVVSGARSGSASRERTTRQNVRRGCVVVVDAVGECMYNSRMRCDANLDHCAAVVCLYPFLLPSVRSVFIPLTLYVSSLAYHYIFSFLILLLSGYYCVH